jgi:DNA-binding MarR family transcriptional regulator
MGIGESFGFGSGEASTYRLTEVGKQRIEMQNGTGFELQILQKLDQQGPSTSSEVARYIQTYDQEKVKMTLRELKQKGCIQ